MWEGFIKCCERTTPNSFQVLLQLPPEQLQEVFQESPDLKPALLEHVLSYTENQVGTKNSECFLEIVNYRPIVKYFLFSQRSHIPQAIMDILYGVKTPVYNDFNVKNEPVSAIILYVVV